MQCGLKRLLKIRCGSFTSWIRGNAALFLMKSHDKLGVLLIFRLAGHISPETNRPIDMNLKKYLPYLRYTLRTRLSMDEVQKRLGEQAVSGETPAGSGFFSNLLPTFLVSVHGRYFEVQIIVQGRNSLVSIVNGTMYDDAAGVSLDIEMAVRTEIKWFLIVWFAGTGFGAAICAIHLVKLLFTAAFHGSDMMLLVPFLMLAFGYFLIAQGFTNVCYQCRTFLAELLDGDEELQ